MHHSPSHFSRLNGASSAGQSAKCSRSTRFRIALSILTRLLYQEDNKGGNIRAALREQTGSKTIPQIYIGGRHIGGATELFDACKSGEMQKLLGDNNVPFNADVDVDPYSFLPGWLQAR